MRPVSRPPEGPEDVLALAHAWEREALRARAKGDIQRADQLDENAARARELVAAWQRLTGSDKARTIIDENMAHVETAAPRRRGRPTKSRHPFPRALSAAGSNVAEWARANGYEREVVKSWFSPAPSGRRIPRVAAKAIEKEFGVPATDKVWTNGIR